ncbi:MAG TPA: PhnD/SsuA/transferrin family substrate-binding protein [Gemmataceae bacterium]|nr:PhnD/SsuA/transferrin family substrate-binding protein [Gemmataceae bacterium]
MYRLVLLAAGLSLAGPDPARAGDKAVVRIGLPRSIFRDVPPALLTFAGQPFNELMKAQTGLDGEVVNEPDAVTIAREIDAGKVHLGVFMGHEFAWARQKYPDLEPIVCSVPKPREIQAFLLVRWDSKVASLGDLKGCKLTLATTTRDHARLFLEKRRTDEMSGGAFCSTDKTTTVHDAIHKVIDGEADVTVADLASWSYFQKLYPGKSQNLKVLAKSEVFPPTVIAYKKGGVDDAVVKKLRDGLLTAHQSPKGARLMNTIKVERFDHPPAGYEEALKECLKVYPAPVIDRASADK